MPTPPSPSSELSHEDALSALAKVRKEVADSHVKLRELSAKFEGAKTPAEVEALVTEIKDAAAKEARDLLIENVALKAELPNSAIPHLRGETREELEADAEELGLLGAGVDPDPEPESPRGGLNPTRSDEDRSFNAAALARRQRTSRRYF